MNELHNHQIDIILTFPLVFDFKKMVFCLNVQFNLKLAKEYAKHRFKTLTKR